MFDSELEFKHDRIERVFESEFDKQNDYCAVKCVNKNGERFERDKDIDSSIELKGELLNLSELNREPNDLSLSYKYDTNRSEQRIINVEKEIYHICMDIRMPIENIKVHLQQVTNRNLVHYEFWLQNNQILQSYNTLINHCIEVMDPIQIDVEILSCIKRINITDVVIPTREIAEMVSDISPWPESSQLHNCDNVLYETEQNKNSYYLSYGTLIR